MEEKDREDLYPRHKKYPSSLGAEVEAFIEKNNPRAERMSVKRRKP